jgi:hypothetical protein
MLSAAPVAAAPHAENPLSPVSMTLTDADLELAADYEAFEELTNEVPEVLLDWSANPGVFESDLVRRSGNSLYLESRRRIGEPELLAAKRRDAELTWQTLESFVELLSRKKRMSKLESASEMGDALLRIDEATWGALRVGGEAYKLAASIQELRSWLLGEWQVSSLADPGVQALLDAEERIPTVETQSSAIRFLALIQVADDADAMAPIAMEEFGVALMSEEPATIRKVYQALQGDLKEKLALQLSSLLEEIEREEIEFDRSDQKIAEVLDLLGLEPAVATPEERASSY